MNIYEKLKKDRGGCIAEVKEASIKSVEAAAELFGLSNNVGVYKRIGRQEAVAVLQSVLHKDMTYYEKIMSESKCWSVVDASNRRNFDAAGWPNLLGRYENALVTAELLS